jgi:hypothetical protein
MNREARGFGLLKFPDFKKSKPNLYVVKLQPCEAQISEIQQGETFSFTAKCEAERCDLGRATSSRDTLEDAKVVRSQVFQIQCPLLKDKLVNVIPPERLPSDFNVQHPQQQSLPNSQS